MRVDLSLHLVEHAAMSAIQWPTDGMVIVLGIAVVGLAVSVWLTLRARKNRKQRRGPILTRWR